MDRFFERFDEVTGNVVIKPELTQLKEYKAILDRDKTKGKQEAQKQLTYIWAICSLDESTCMYADILDKAERVALAKDDIFGSKSKYDPDTDELVKQAVIAYRQHNPKNEYDEQVEFMYGEVTRLRRFIQNFNYEQERTEGGAMVLKPEDIRKVVESTAALVKDIDTMRTLAKEKREREKSIRGGGVEGLFENPNNASYL
jgi:hypothetical protein